MKLQMLIDMSVEDQHRFIVQQNLCFICFGEHSVKTCPSRFKCHICHKKHHILLNSNQSRMFPFVPNTSDHNCTNSAQPPSSCEKLPSTSAFLRKGITGVDTVQGEKPFKSISQVLHATIKVNVLDNFGNGFVCRAILESGSQSSFISENLSQLLQLNRRKIYQPVVVIY